MSDTAIKSSTRISILYGLLRVAFNALLLFFALLLVGFVLFVSSIEREFKKPPKAEGIAVLTGDAARIDEAMGLLAEGKAERLLISGVYQKTTKKELEALGTKNSQYLSCCVDLDHEAQNTIDNATETSAWAARHGYHSVIIVTSNYHMPRALAELGRTMPAVELYPYAVIDKKVHLDDWWLYPGTTKLLLSEYLKYLPAMVRLAATRVVSKIVYGEWRSRPEEIDEP
ncbi:MAG: YdcF family protein [Methyloligella sp. ZOD6]